MLVVFDSLGCYVKKMAPFVDFSKMQKLKKISIHNFSIHTTILHLRKIKKPKRTELHNIPGYEPYYIRKLHHPRF